MDDPKDGRGLRKSLVLFVATTPYGQQNADTALLLAEAALAKGHRVRLFLSGDGVYVAQVGQRPSGIPNVPAAAIRLMEAGLQIDLCGSCIRYRGLGQELLQPGAEPGSLKGLFAAVAEADAFVSFTG